MSRRRHFHKIIPFFAYFILPVIPIQYAFLAVLTTPAFTSLPCQMAAHFPLVKALPWNHFGRKNVGYLYAILHGAKVRRHDLVDVFYLQCCSHRIDYVTLDIAINSVLFIIVHVQFISLHYMTWLGSYEIMT
jgi:hypothetical protein